MFVWGLMTVSFLMSIALALETVGVWGRHWGKVVDKPSTGYSLHVRTATLGRFLTFAAAPTLGFAVDRTGDTSLILLQGLFVNISLFCLVVLIYFWGWENILNMYSKVLSIEMRKSQIPHRRINNTIFFASTLSFLFTANGLIIANFLGALFIDYRASFVQLTSLITATGTIIHVFIADPLISKLIDTSLESSQEACASYLWGRTFGAIISAILFVSFVSLMP